MVTVAQPFAAMARLLAVANMLWIFGSSGLECLGGGAMWVRASETQEFDLALWGFKSCNWSPITQDHGSTVPFGDPYGESHQLAIMNRLAKRLLRPVLGKRTWTGREVKKCHRVEGLVRGVCNQLACRSSTVLIRGECEFFNQVAISREAAGLERLLSGLRASVPNRADPKDCCKRPPAPVIRIQLAGLEFSLAYSEARQYEILALQAGGTLSPVSRRAFAEYYIRQREICISKLERVARAVAHISQRRIRLPQGEIKFTQDHFLGRKLQIVSAASFFQDLALEGDELVADLVAKVADQSAQLQNLLAHCNDQFVMATSPRSSVAAR